VRVRAIIVILMLAVIVVIAGFMLGFIDISQTQMAKLPSIEVKGGQAPTFNVSTAKVEVGTKEKTVEVPNVDVGTKTKTVEVPTVAVSKP
jgi:hypothetical protein